MKYIDHIKKHLTLITAFVIITIIFGTIEVAVQQTLRLGANDPQIQIAEDTARALNNNLNPENLLTGDVDIRSSLAPFTIIYDKQGNIVASNGYINGKAPKVPIGVLDASQHHNYNFITWQPAKDIRIASVSVSANSYYVLSGRNLREVENREQQLMNIVLIGWVTSNLIVFLPVFIIKKTNKKDK